MVALRMARRIDRSRVKRRCRRRPGPASAALGNGSACGPASMFRHGYRNKRSRWKRQVAGRSGVNASKVPSFSQGYVLVITNVSLREIYIPLHCYNFISLHLVLRTCDCLEGVVGIMQTRDRRAAVHIGSAFEAAQDPAKTAQIPPLARGTGPGKNTASHREGPSWEPIRVILQFLFAHIQAKCRLKAVESQPSILNGRDSPARLWRIHLQDSI